MLCVGRVSSSIVTYSSTLLAGRFFYADRLEKRGKECPTEPISDGLVLPIGLQDLRPGSQCDSSSVFPPGSFQGMQALGVNCPTLQVRIEGTTPTRRFVVSVLFASKVRNLSTRPIARGAQPGHML